MLQFVVGLLLGFAIGCAAVVVIAFNAGMREGYRRLFQLFRYVNGLEADRQPATRPCPAWLNWTLGWLGSRGEATPEIEPEDDQTVQ